MSECLLCKKELSKGNKTGYCRTCFNKSDKKIIARKDCSICGKSISLLAYTRHIRSCSIEKNSVNVNVKRVAWNKGLSKETSPSLRKAGETYKENIKTGKYTPHNLGKHLSDEQKKKISDSRIEYLKNNPDKVPYKLNHYSKGPSYPEQYFLSVIENEKIDLKYHKQIGNYELDFYNEEKKIVLEIDGEQHYVDKRIEKSDKRRTSFLENLGWKIIRIRWSSWQKLTKEEREKEISKLKEISGPIV